jgi:hypothetical protein
MTFTTMNLTGERVLVQGSDIYGGSGKTVVDGSQWAELSARSDFNDAAEAFDAAVEEFFAPLMEAAEKASKAVAKPDDSSSYIVLDEGTEGVEAKPAQIVRLTRDSVILRMIEEGSTDRLVWVDDQLEVLQTLPGTSTSPAPATSGDPHSDEPAEASPED